MDPTSKSVAGYDRLANWYRLLEWLMFGQQLRRARIALADRIPKASRALVLGDGDGRLLEHLAHTQRECRFVSVDQSPRMIELQKARLANAVDAKVEFVCADATRHALTGDPIDLLVLPFFLDCFTPDQLRVYLPRWLDAVAENGSIYIVDFVQPRRLWRRRQSDLYQSVMHRFFRWQTGLPNKSLVDLDPILRELPIVLSESARDLHPMLTCRIYRKTKSNDHAAARTENEPDRAT